MDLRKCEKYPDVVEFGDSIDKGRLDWSSLSMTAGEVR